MTIEAFRVETDPHAIDDLRRRLAGARYSDAVTEDWSYGTSPTILLEVIERWRAHDWAARVAELNALPHFRAVVDGIGIHFLHFRGRGRAPRALLLANGWPSSFIEYSSIARELADPAASGGDPDDAFDVVIPAMPGYGFSDRPTRPNAPRAYELYHRLMSEGLGYERYAIAGSDIGFGVATRMALRHPDAVASIHISGSGPPPHVAPELLTDDERAFLDRVARWQREEGAYAAIQSTRPQTLAFALADSPVGMASWLLEKYYAWTDRRERDVLAIYGNALLDTLTLYWLTGTIGSSMRLYYESRRWPHALGTADFVRVPTSALVLPGDIAQPPRSWLERFYNIERYVVAERGGHFPALEVPEFYVNELRSAFRGFVAAPSRD